MVEWHVFVLYWWVEELTRRVHKPGLATEHRGDPRLACAVGETVIVLTHPVLSLLKHLVKVQGGCYQMTVSPTASSRRACATAARNPARPVRSCSTSS